MASKTELFEVFNQYIDDLPEEPICNNEELKILESHEPFIRLVELTKSLYENDYHSGSLSTWKKHIQDFFRRSGLYLKEKFKIDTELFFNLYDTQFTRKEEDICYLVPLEGLYLEDCKALDFGTYTIKQFSPVELYNKVGNYINHIFYPYAEWDINKLSSYWYLQVKERKELLGIGKFCLDFSDLNNVRRKLTEKYPKNLKMALYTLILYDWKPKWLCQDNHYGPWQGFKIPFIAEIGDDLIRSPRPSPDISQLEVEPFFNEKEEEIGEKPFEWIELSKKEISNFKEYINNTVKLVDENILQQWPFIDTALGYLLKAFLVNPFSDSPSQLLWHMTTIEALFGEKGQAITRKLTYRLGQVLARTKGQKKTIKKDFEKLYDIRCDLVHGNPWKENLENNILYSAREMANQSILWFLKCLYIIRSEKSPHTEIPTREHILALIDLDKNCKMSFKKLFDWMPEELTTINEL